MDALGLQPDLLYLSTTGNFDVPNLTGADEDIFGFTPTAISASGAVSAGKYKTGPLFDGSFYGLGLNDVTGVDFGF